MSTNRVPDDSPASSAVTRATGSDAGQTISHYRILSKLGAGGMGVVYQAEDTRLKRTVALKFLPPELTRDEGAKTRFIHEAQAASALQHHNICTIHDIDETPDGHLFIAMDCYPGETLKETVGARAALGGGGGGHREPGCGGAREGA